MITLHTYAVPSKYMDVVCSTLYVHAPIHLDTVKTIVAHYAISGVVFVDPLMGTNVCAWPHEYSEGLRGCVEHFSYVRETPAIEVTVLLG